MPTAISGNWIDLLLIFGLCLYTWEGYQRGFIASFLDALNLIIVFFLSIFAYGYLSYFLRIDFSFPWIIAQPLSFTIIAIVTQQILTSLSSELLLRLPRKYERLLYSHLFSFFPIIMQYVALCVSVLLVCTVLPLPQIIKTGIIGSSVNRYIQQRIFTFEQLVRSQLNVKDQAVFAYLPAPQDQSQYISLNSTQDALTHDVESESLLKKTIAVTREKIGLRPLIEDEQLNIIARSHAKEMFNLGYLGSMSTQHKSLEERLREAEYPFTVVRQQSALSPLGTLFLDDVEMNLPLGELVRSTSYTKLGVAVVDSGVYGKIAVEILAD